MKESPQDKNKKNESTADNSNTTSSSSINSHTSSSSSFVAASSASSASTDSTASATASAAASASASTAAANKAMKPAQTLRGTRDLIGDECRRFRFIAEVARKCALRYSYNEIETPIIESTSTFKKTLGETSDVVGKEMYNFIDRGGEECTLRPEGTAPVARAIISNGLQQHLPLKLFYNGPMFRYERPQKGRYRQFYQFGVELLGISEPSADIEVLALSQQILKELGLAAVVQLEINTLGDLESRSQYRTALVEYLQSFRTQLSEDSQKRLDLNPLRILDSKDAGDKKILASAPQLHSFLSNASQDFFQAVQDGLKNLEIEFIVSPHLVRGLDYYSHVVFEWTTKNIGAQNAVIAGGRYDGLISSMGGPATPGVGWAAGTDRLALLIEQPSSPAPDLAIVPVYANSTDLSTNKLVSAASQRLAYALRAQGKSIELGLSFSGNVGNRLKRADKLGTRWALILGEQELQSGTAQIKDLKQGQQESIQLNVESLLKKISQ